MTIKRKNNWPELVKLFEASGLTQAKFCKQNNLNPKYFGLKRSQILAASKSSAFQKIEVENKVSGSPHLVIEFGRCKIHCPTSMSIQQLTLLVQGLA